MNGNEIIALLSSGAEMMSSAVAPVVGALFTAIFLRHNTKTDEFEKIKAGQFKEVANDLLKSGEMTYTEYYKAKNFLIVAEKADSYYKGHARTEVHGNYEFDWFVRFFEAVGNVSDETMQNLWAKILAGELVRPSTFSLKSIDVMRNLSKRDAELFMKVCSHAFAWGTNICLPNEDAYIEFVGVQYTDIMKLSELGLIFNNSFITLNCNLGDKPRIIFRTNNLVMLMSSASGDSETVCIGQYPFTEVGKELSTMISERASEEDFLKYGQILSHDKKCKISVHKILKWDGGSIEYNRINLLSTEGVAIE